MKKQNIPQKLTEEDLENFKERIKFGNYTEVEGKKYFFYDDKLENKNLLLDDKYLYIPFIDEEGIYQFKRTLESYFTSLNQ